MKPRLDQPKFSIILVNHRKQTFLHQVRGLSFMILKWYKMSGLGQSTPILPKGRKTSFRHTYSPYGIRTRVAAVKGGVQPLTNGP